jgi:signal transduction histidine kinase
LQQQNGNLILSIKDDGKGFDKEKAAGKKTLGILGMEERSFMMGGNYQINSKPGEGTLVIVSVPHINN